MYSVPPLPPPWPHIRVHTKWSHPPVSWDEGKSLNEIVASGVDGEHLRVRTHSWNDFCRLGWIDDVLCVGRVGA